MVNVGSDMSIPFSGSASAGVVLVGHRNGRRDFSPTSAIPACEMARVLAAVPGLGKRPAGYGILFIGFSHLARIKG